MPKKPSHDAKPRKLLGFRASANIHAEIDFLNKHYRTKNNSLFEKLIHAEYLNVTSGIQPGNNQSPDGDRAASRSNSDEQSTNNNIQEAVNHDIGLSSEIGRIRNSSKLSFLTAQYTLRELLHYLPLLLKVVASNSNIDTKAFDKLQADSDSNAAKRYALILNLIQENEAGVILEKLSERIM